MYVVNVDKEENKTGSWGPLTLRSQEEKVKSEEKTWNKRKEEKQEDGVFWKPIKGSV